MLQLNKVGDLLVQDEIEEGSELGVRDFLERDLQVKQCHLHDRKTGRPLIFFISVAFFLLGQRGTGPWQRFGLVLLLRSSRFYLGKVGQFKTGAFVFLVVVDLIISKFEGLDSLVESEVHAATPEGLYDEH